MANDEDAHGDPTPRAADVQPVPAPGTRLRHWLHRPRRPLGVRDALPHGGGLFLPVFVAAALIYGGFSELLGSGPTFRTGGFFALFGGAFVTVLIALYLRRPPTRR